MDAYYEVDHVVVYPGDCAEILPHIGMVDHLASAHKTHAHQ